MTTTGYYSGYDGGANKEYTFAFEGTSSATPMVVEDDILLLISPIITQS